MYDVNFGGKRMTKRLTIALVALAMFVLVAIMPASAAFYVVNTSINQSATVFIGEQGLNLTGAAQGQIDQQGTVVDGGATGVVPTKIGWWASSADPFTSSPSATYTLPAAGTSTTISYAAFGSYYGPWYAINTTTGYRQRNATVFMYVQDPQLSVDVWDFSQGTQGGVSVSGKTVVVGDFLGFKIGTNMQAAINNARLRTNETQTLYGIGSNLSGWANIVVKTDQGNTFTRLYNGSTTGVGPTAGITSPLTQIPVNLAEYYWGAQTGVPSATSYGNWSTGAFDASGQAAYPAGTYTVTVESKLNGMLDNYQLGGASYTGKTVTEAKTVQLVSDTVKITANKDTVVRSKPFSITVTGKPSTNYHIWVKGTSTMTGAYDSQPPIINQNQDGVTFDPIGQSNAYVGTMSSTALKYYVADGPVLGYLYQNSGSATRSVWNDVAKGTGTTDALTLENGLKIGNGSYLAANISTTASGTRTVEFITTNWTKAQKYTIRVEANISGVYKSDEVDVKVEKGAVTIVAAGDQSYYLGEEIKFSGTNTETSTTYLFISGPNLQEFGSQFTENPRTAPAGGTTGVSPASLTAASVAGDNTWSWKWGTANVALDAGTYTVWATSNPSDNKNTRLDKVAYGTVSIVLKKPFISATTSQSTVAQGDKITILGTAEGSPTVGVQIWILGKNYATVTQKAVNADATFSYEIARTTTTNLAPGQYFVVGQHPMQNNAFDIRVTDTDSNTVTNYQLGAAGTKVFTLLGAGSLQGSDAAEALVQAINDPNVDDTYTKLQFLVENPTITIVPVGDKHVGDKFTIVAATNMAVDDEVLCQVYSSSFKPTQKTQSGEFSGASATVKVTKGDAGMNKISFDVDASTFKPDEYIVQMDGVLVSATGTALFNVLEGAAPTAVPTKVVVVVVATTAAPTTVPPTTVATPTKTPTQPGFGALVALIGLGAVALLVVRRH
jgi:trimeric autotransporter adhesin